MVKLGFWKDRRGQAVVETALTFIPFFILIGFIFQSAYWYVAHQVILQKAIEAVDVASSTGNPCSSNSKIHEADGVVVNFNSKAKVVWSVVNNPSLGGASGNGKWNENGLILYVPSSCVPSPNTKGAWRADYDSSTNTSFVSNGNLIQLDVEYDLPFKLIPLKVLQFVRVRAVSMPNCESNGLDSTYPFC